VVKLIVARFHNHLIWLKFTPKYFIQNYTRISEKNVRNV